MSWPLGAAAKRNRFRVSARKRVSHHSPRASFVLNSVIHLVTLARRHMLDPRRVGAASPEVARRRSPLGHKSFESFGSFESVGPFSVLQRLNV